MPNKTLDVDEFYNVFVTKDWDVTGIVTFDMNTHDYHDVLWVLAHFYAALEHVVCGTKGWTPGQFKKALSVCKEMSEVQLETGKKPQTR